ncbi:hypothetical protein LOTGIDRAFT_174712 [Lottia gigantea]|uniref:Uncharacterized protein n=1 Tax=Lottia gigantea TaxID=225164 RepID=V4APK2_LOTGI|nr:hypothetical protein LOTGIDRAFT_174712 [Lottia gigantea]ESO96720.1 hypothetical protein LOTGIDRAFT_174712 [Lottia gigantea]
MIKQSLVTTGLHNIANRVKRQAYIPPTASNLNNSPLIASSFEDVIETLGDAQAANYSATFLYKEGDVLIKNLIKEKDSNNNASSSTCQGFLLYVNNKHLVRP